MTYAGIDYSGGKSNFDTKTGIHYGVISQHSVPQEMQDDFEDYFGEPTCPKCGEKAVEFTGTELQAHSPSYSDNGCEDYFCATCEHTLESGEVFSEERQGFSYNKDGYKLSDCLDSDIFVLESPYYTFAQFCSPCVPGAGNLDTPCAEGPKTYCLGHDWFEDGKAPYPVFSVKDGSMVPNAQP